MRRYLIDTAIWIDLYEDRVGYNGAPLGRYAWRLVTKIRTTKDRIIVTDLLIVELQTKYSLDQIASILAPFASFIDKYAITEAERAEAKLLAKQRSLPQGDSLHAVVARDQQFILITRDKHFQKLTDIAPSFKPEDFI